MLRAWWDEHGHLVGIIGGIFVLGLVLGRYSAAGPEKHLDDSVTIVKQEWSSRVYDRSESSTRVVVRDRFIEVGGAVHEHEEERDASLVVEHTAENSGARLDSTEHRTVSLVPSVGSLRLSILAGASLSTDPLAVSPLFGIGFEHKLAGPFSAGALLLFRPHPFEAGALGSLSVQW